MLELMHYIYVSVMNISLSFSLSHTHTQNVPIYDSILNTKKTPRQQNIYTRESVFLESTHPCVLGVITMPQLFLKSRMSCPMPIEVMCFTWFEEKQKQKWCVVKTKVLYALSWLKSACLHLVLCLVKSVVLFMLSWLKSVLAAYGGCFAHPITDIYYLLEHSCSKKRENTNLVNLH